VTREPFAVRFLPDRRVHTADAPVEFYLAAAAVGILVEQPCGSQGTCGRCRVRVTEGAPAPTTADRVRFTAGELADGWRLGCQLVFGRSAAVEVLAVTRSLAGKSFGGDLPVDALSRPRLHTRTLSLPVAEQGGAASAIDAIASAVGLPPRALTASPEALAELALVGSVPAPVAVAIHDRELICARPGAGIDPLGLAVDIGTTSLAAALVSLADGSVRASASCLNPQVAFGADVISRIRHAIDRPEGTTDLSTAVRGGLAALVAELTAAAGRKAHDILLAAVAGNPTMMHAWLGVPPGSLGRAPYLGLWTGALTVKASSVQMPARPNADVFVFPLIRSHVGGDTVAAAIACGLDLGRTRRLLIDLGTNSEVLVAHDSRIAATSAAAGPAFEGGSIRHGMRAAPGAVDIVSMARDGHVSTHTIGDVPAKGLCGSGLIDAVAELLRAGLISSSGYLRKAEEIGDGGPLSERLVRVDGQQTFTIVPARDTDGGSGPVTITARDVREVQLAKGSIVAAVTLACRHVGLDPADLDEVLIAGAFGNYLRKASVLRIGLVPEIDPERVRFVGNAAGVGARLALLDREVLERGRELAARAEYLDLATHQDYQTIFMNALAFPERRPQ
jgi:uncharacterized 2Fe-2S/4Fe-4S cluster protein (DUF4445 family)